jgi:hypothetical protein
VALGVLTVDEARSHGQRATRGRKRKIALELPAGMRGRTGRWAAALPLVVVGAGALAILALVSDRGGDRPRRGAAPRSVTVGAAEVLRDETGRVLRISAPDPRSVLAAYCRTGRGQGRFELVDLVPAPVDPARTRLGLLRDSAERQVVLAITIEEDRDRWVAGDGTTPIEARRAPAWASDARSSR